MLDTITSRIFRIIQVCLRGCQRALERVYLALCGGHHGSLLIGLHLSLESLLLRNGASLREPRVGIAVEFGKPQRGLLLREIRFRGRKVRLRLSDSARRIGRGLGGLELILVQLILQHCDLIASGLRFGLRVGQRGPRLIFARARTCASSSTAITWPAETVSPSRTVTSRIFPVTFGATAESSPSIRPLSATMLSGKLGLAKKTFPDDERGNYNSRDKEGPLRQASVELYFQLVAHQILEAGSALPHDGRRLSHRAGL